MKRKGRGDAGKRRGGGGRRGGERDVSLRLRRNERSGARPLVLARHEHDQENGQREERQHQQDAEPRGDPAGEKVKTGQAQHCEHRQGSGSSLRDVHVSVEESLRVNAPVALLGEERPGQGVDEHDGGEKEGGNCDDTPDEVRVPPVACGKSLTDAANDSRFPSEPPGIAQVAEKSLAGGRLGGGVARHVRVHSIYSARVEEKNIWGFPRVAP